MQQGWGTTCRHCFSPWRRGHGVPIPPSTMQLLKCTSGVGETPTTMFVGEAWLGAWLAFSGTREPYKWRCRARILLCAQEIHGVCFISQLRRNVAPLSDSQDEVLLIVSRVCCSCWLWQFCLALVPEERRCCSTEGFLMLSMRLESSVQRHSTSCDGKAKRAGPSRSFIVCS